MRKAAIIVVILISSSSIRATNISMSEIRDSIESFLVRVEHMNAGIFNMIPDEQFNNNIWKIKNKESIAEGMTGIFLVRIGSHNASHFLLVEENGFQIINMRDSFIDNLKVLLNFLERNEADTKDDAIFHMKAFIRINESNLKMRESMRLYKDCIPTSDVALEISEVILKSIYGSDLVEKQDMLSGYLKENEWIVDMRVKLKEGQEKIVSVEIDKETGAILKIVDIKQ